MLATVFQADGKDLSRGPPCTHTVIFPAVGAERVFTPWGLSPARASSMILRPAVMIS